jgi:hypothetical protein
MSFSQLETRDFNRLVSLSEAACREDNQRSDEAFVAAVNREIKRGKLKVRPGTFVDSTPLPLKIVPSRS